MYRVKVSKSISIRDILFRRTNIKIVHVMLNI